MAEMCDHTESSYIGRHFVFAMATDRPRPGAGPNMLIFSTLISFAIFSRHGSSAEGMGHSLSTTSSVAYSGIP